MAAPRAQKSRTHKTRTSAQHKGTGWKSKKRTGGNPGPSTRCHQKDKLARSAEVYRNAKSAAVRLRSLRAAEAASPRQARGEQGRRGGELSPRRAGPIRRRRALSG